jgi:[acyl-carrier-protein] S-malonyltransferase
MLASAYAFFKVWESEGGVMPVIMAGHSLGEYTAATAAGVFSFEDAIKVVRFRAQAMQEAVPAGVGGMAAVLNLDINVIRDICQKSSMPGSVVEPVNLNTLEQTVIAGHQSAIERVSPILKEAGAKRVISLPVSAPFHSSLMKPAADRLGQFLSQISMNRPHIPFVNNIDVQEESSAEKIRDAFVRQAYGPVRWVELIRYLESFGVTDVVECGPGKVLSGLITKLTSGKMRVFSINHKDSLSSAMEALTGI